jgi:hypothetical protein
MFAKTINGDSIDKYPIDLKQEFPDISWPTIFSSITEEMLPQDVVTVYPTQRPSVNVAEEAIEDLPAFIDGKWQQQWKIVALAQQQVVAKHEAQWSFIRNQRDEILKKTDWIVIRSIEQQTEVPQEIKDYRQALRDITLQENPFNIVWPTDPYVVEPANDLTV